MGRSVAAKRRRRANCRLEEQQIATPAQPAQVSSLEESPDAIPMRPAQEPRPDESHDHKAIPAQAVKEPHVEKRGNRHATPRRSAQEPCVDESESHSFLLRLPTEIQVMICETLAYSGLKKSLLQLSNTCKVFLAIARTVGNKHRAIQETMLMDFFLMALEAGDRLEKACGMPHGAISQTGIKSFRCRGLSPSESRREYEDKDSDSEEEHSEEEHSVEEEFDVEDVYLDRKSLGNYWRREHQYMFKPTNKEFRQVLRLRQSMGLVKNAVSRLGIWVKDSESEEDETQIVPDVAHPLYFQRMLAFILPIILSMTPEITHLEIEVRAFSTLIAPSKAIDLSHLTRLDFRLQQVADNATLPYILRCAPNLSQLLVRKVTLYKDDIEIKTTSLKYISLIDCQFSPIVLSALARASPKLEHLRVDSDFCGYHESFAEEVLALREHWRDTLESLDIEYTRIGRALGGHQGSLTDMKALKNLDIKRSDPRQWETEADPSRFLPSTLEMLSIGWTDSDKTRPWIRDFLMIPSLREAHFPNLVEVNVADWEDGPIFHHFKAGIWGKSKRVDTERHGYAGVRG